MQCTEALQLIYNQELTEVFPNISTALKLYLAMTITSCEAEINFSKLAFIKNKFRSTMSEDRLNYLSILSIENDIARKLSFDKTVHEDVLENTTNEVGKNTDNLNYNLLGKIKLIR